MMRVCMYIQSFCSALNNELTEYYRLIAVLDAQSQQDGEASGGVAGLTLRRLLVWTHDPRERLQMLAILVDGCKRTCLASHGVVMDDYLYMHVQV